MRLGVGGGALGGFLLEKGKLNVTLKKNNSRKLPPARGDISSTDLCLWEYARPREPGQGLFFDRSTCTCLHGSCVPGMS